MDPHTLKKLNEARLHRQAAVVVTSLTDGKGSLFIEGEPLDGALGAAVSKAFLDGKSTTVEIDNREFFLNAHLPPPRIVVIGAVHISQALAAIAKTAGYALEVIDPRTAFATPERFAETELFPDWPEDVLVSRPLDSYSALAAVTHDPKIDDFPLTAALKAECFYIGALGSRKTHAKRLERMQEQGVSAEALERIHSPIGLDIGASSPQEIAVAIMAEIIGAFRTRGLG